MVAQAKPASTLPPIVAASQGSDFYLAAALTFPFEGGEVNDPQDPGGHTKFGISQRAYPNEDITNMTLERAQTLAKRDYWYPMRLDVLNSQMVSNNLFDFAFNHGVRGVVKKLQLVLAKSFGFKGVVDGIMGSSTMGFINELILSSQSAPFALHQDMIKARLEYYLSYGQPKYLNGYIARTTAFL